MNGRDQTSLPRDWRTAFGKRVIEALQAFANTNGQCVSLCAYISARLTEDGIENRVALGSLSCSGVKTFEYKRPFSAEPFSSVTFWEGHAWLEFSGGMVGEPSLFRTARACPENSNLRRTLYAHGLLERGALLISAETALEDYGLNYQRVTYLEKPAFMPLIGGLMAINNFHP